MRLALGQRPRRALRQRLARHEADEAVEVIDGGSARFTD